MPIKITYFVHGTTKDNEKDIATGWNPGELSEIGIEQAKELGKIVSNKKFDFIFCSDLKRAVDSANLGFGGKYKIIEDSRLREANYGDFTGNKDSFKNELLQYIENPFPNGESYKEVEARLKSFCEYLKNNFEGKEIGIVAHQGPQLALEVILNKKTWKEAIDNDWRKTKSWQPGWEYIIN